MTLGEYLALVTSFHSTRPRYMNTVATLVRPLVDAQAMLAKLTADFDLDTAIGVQLDQVGQWIGRTRYVREPIDDVFFALDTPNLGLDQGVWEGVWDATDRIIALDDETYRAVLKLQALANHWDGTIPSIAEAFNALFPGVVIDDRGDKPGEIMAMDVYLPASHLSALLLEVLIQTFMLKPSGVRVNILQSTVVDTPIFALDLPATPGGPFAGLDAGTWAELVYSA